MQFSKTWSKPLRVFDGRAWLKIAPLAVLVVLLILSALRFTTVLAQVTDLIPGLRAASPAYQTQPAGRGNVAVSVIATGPVTAVNQLPLTFKTSGKLAELKVKVGDTVKQGEVIAKLDTTDLQVALDQAKASLAQAQANQSKIEAGPTDAQKSVAQASVTSAKTSTTDAQKTVASTQSSTAKDVSAAQAAAANAATSLATAQASVAAAQDEQAKGIAADQVAVASAQKNLDGVKATVATNPSMRLQSLEKAKDDLWSAQINRDAACGRDKGASCQAGNATVAAAETAVNSAQAQVDQGQKQDAQNVAQAEASLAQAQSQMATDQTKLAAAVVSAQNAVKQAQGSVQTAQVGVAQSQAKAVASVQSAQAQANQAANAVNSAEANYAQTTSGPTPSDLDAAKAQVASALAAVSQAQANLDAATLTAPFDGTIAAINGTVGQYISGGSSGATSSTTNTTSGLVTLISLSDLQVSAQVNEADIGKIKTDDPVAFTVSAFPNRQFSGKVIGIQPTGTVTQNVVNYNVISSIQSVKDAPLFPGMTATATITADQRTNALLVPNTAISFAQTAFRDGLVSGRGGNGGGAGQGQNGGQPSGQGGNRSANSGPGSSGANATGGANANGQSGANRGVVLALQNGQLSPVSVAIGITDGTSTEIVSGLQDGQLVVIGQSGGTARASGGQAPGQGTTRAAPATSNPLGGGAGGPRG